MEPTIAFKRTARQGRPRLLMGMLPVAACLALAVPAATTLAQTTNQSVACAAAQKAGEGEGGYAGTTATASQKAGEGEGGYSGTTATALQKAGEAGAVASLAQQQQKTSVIPCRG